MMLVSLRRYIHTARQNSAAEWPTLGIPVSRRAKRCARHSGRKPNRIQTAADAAQRQTEPTTMDCKVWAASASSIPPVQKMVPSKATSRQRPHNPTARSIITVATATVRRLCSRAINAALTMSPPTEPGRNVLKNRPTDPRRMALPSVNGNSWARTRTYQRTKVRSTPSK